MGHMEGLGNDRRSKKASGALPARPAAFTVPLLYFAVHSKQGIIHGLFWPGTPH